MNSILTHQHHQLKKNVPVLHAGDRVRVHQKIKEGSKERIQIFEGLVIKSQNGQGINGSFTVRRISLGVGVEKCFPLHLPSITKIEKLKSAKVRRARLFYVRDLVGRKAQKLKKEKEDKAVWEDVIAEEKTSDQPSAISDQPEGKEETPEAEEAEKPTGEKIEETKNEKGEEKNDVDEKTDKPENKPEKEKTDSKK